jgi:hypothetical protein
MQKETGMLRLTIPQPCQESWNEMTPVERGAFCKSCSKTVIDFSAMSDAAILHHLQSNKSEACGRFRNEQLNRPLAFISAEALTMDIPIWKKYLAILFICFSAILTGCKQPGDINPYYISPDPPFENIPGVDSTMGKTDSANGPVPANTNESSAIKPNCNARDGEIYTMGMIGTEIHTLSPVLTYPGPSLLEQLLGKYKYV